MRITRLTTIARTGRLTNRSVSRILTILRLRSRFVGWLNLVVDQNGRAVAELENSGGDDLLVWFDTGENRDLIATRCAEFDKLLAHAAIRLTLRILHLFDDENR